MRCSSCRGDLRVEDVYAQKRITNIDSHVVLHYKCGVCGYQDSLVIEKKDWIALVEGGNVEKPTRTQSNNTILMKLAQIDLEGVQYVEDIELYWKAQKTPLVMEGRQCDCDDCRKRLYG